MKDSEFESFKRELLIASDVRSFIELLQRVFDEENEEKGLTKSDLAKLVRRDLSYVSRILNGRQKNVTVHTLAHFMRAMGRRLEATQSRLSDLESRKANYVILPNVERAPHPRTLSSRENAEVSNGTFARPRTYTSKPAKFSSVQ